MPNQNGHSTIHQSVQEIFNQGFDETTGVPVIGSLGYDGQGVQWKNADNLAQKIYTDATYTYICKSAPGASLSDPAWQIKRVDNDGSITWADGDPEFNNIASKYSSLTYS
jgi:hypothetical protein